ncbi:hypothetical protein DPSP01_011435 [Paraphaeosphaeria sporulosa]|uniref:Uncharacterized protein n=1 Tax=Paraphaeosphaeria sporulosa TaxID=1460663 RepID=A0A177CH40_9PLEO|nr:uncharacterized protein CC84DRAFT_756156 [Paraphaeosphaeria sporulosa]OAG06262.1 hypothetical protein CC84DRAFT_756156 [Paraphaeosphaeria sporulosa]
MFNNNHHNYLVPVKPATRDDSRIPRAHDTQLPRGECSFLLPAATLGAARERCSCRSFFPDSLIRSQCGCGHQAWHHEPEPVSTALAEQHDLIVAELKRLRDQVRKHEHLEHQLKQELFKERMAREEHFRTYKGIEARMYANMQHLKVHMDDKVEAVVDKTQEFNDQMKAMQERLTLVDDVTMELENRIDRMELSNGTSREPTPGAVTPKPLLSSPQSVPPVPSLPLLMQSQSILGQLPIRNDKKYPLSWSARVIFVPRKGQKFAYDPDSNGYKRCATRKLQQNMNFPSQDSSCFANCIETTFKGILRGRPWMPMTAHRPQDEPFGRMALALLPSDLTHRGVWDYPFLEDHCIAHDKMQGDVLYITLQFEDVTWNEIRFLPAILGADDSCWKHDEELDGTAKYKSLDSEIMYDYQDPPPTYSSRTHSMADRAPSKLDVLADSASLLSPIERVQTHSSHYSSERSSLRSFSTEETRSFEGTEDDEHCDKKPKLRSKHSMPGANGAGHAPQPIYLSGRSKRKMPVREKGTKEPLHFNVSNVTKWRPNLLHPSSKGKEAIQE